MDRGGIYIHVPYCRNKCLYCDFYSAGARIANWEKYINSIINELEARKTELNFNPTTLYFGGGTPSLLPPKFLSLLAEGIKKITGRNAWEEFTIEINPEDVDIEKIYAWKEIGVNRLSIGIQSLNNKELKAIGRKHTGEAALKSLELLKSNFKNVSVDIIYGLPYQTIETYKTTMEGIISLSPTHISAYSLMLEPGTVLTHKEKRGELLLPEEPEWINMYNYTTDFLKNTGKIRYEISNYAEPGFESKHNLNYWNGKPYLGLGPGAHSYDGINIRKFNPSDLFGYIKHFSEPTFLEYQRKKIFYREERLSKEELKEEMIMTRLRKVEGLNINYFKELFGAASTNNLLEKAEPYLKDGLMDRNNNYLFFTNQGFLVSDMILVRLI